MDQLNIPSSQNEPITAEERSIAYRNNRISKLRCSLIKYFELFNAGKQVEASRILIETLQSKAKGITAQCRDLMNDLLQRSIPISSKCYITETFYKELIFVPQSEDAPLWIRLNEHLGVVDCVFPRYVKDPQHQSRLERVINITRKMDEETQRTMQSQQRTQGVPNQPVLPAHSDVLEQPPNFPIDGHSNTPGMRDATGQLQYDMSLNQASLANNLSHYDQQRSMQNSSHSAFPSMGETMGHASTSHFNTIGYGQQAHMQNHSAMNGSSSFAHEMGEGNGSGWNGRMGEARGNSFSSTPTYGNERQFSNTQRHSAIPQDDDDCYIPTGGGNAMGHIYYTYRPRNSTGPSQPAMSNYSGQLEQQHFYHNSGPSMASGQWANGYSNNAMTGNAQSWSSDQGSSSSYPSQHPIAPQYQSNPINASNWQDDKPIRVKPYWNGANRLGGTDLPRVNSTLPTNSGSSFASGVNDAGYSSNSKAIPDQRLTSSTNSSSKWGSGGHEGLQGASTTSNSANSMTRQYGQMDSVYSWPSFNGSGSNQVGGATGSGTLFEPFRDNLIVNYSGRHQFQSYSSTQSTMQGFPPQGNCPIDQTSASLTSSYSAPVNPLLHSSSLDPINPSNGQDDQILEDNHHDETSSDETIQSDGDEESANDQQAVVPIVSDPAMNSGSIDQVSTVPFQSLSPVDPQMNSPALFQMESLNDNEPSSIENETNPIVGTVGTSMQGMSNPILDALHKISESSIVNDSFVTGQSETNAGGQGPSLTDQSSFTSSFSDTLAGDKLNSTTRNSSNVSTGQDCQHSTVTGPLNEAMNSQGFPLPAEQALISSAHVPSPSPSDSQVDSTGQIYPNESSSKGIENTPADGEVCTSMHRMADDLNVDDSLPKNSESSIPSDWATTGQLDSTSNASAQGSLPTDQSSSLASSLSEAPADTQLHSTAPSSVNQSTDQNELILNESLPAESSSMGTNQPADSSMQEKAQADTHNDHALPNQQRKRKAQPCTRKYNLRSSAWQDESITESKKEDGEETEKGSNQ